MGAPARKRVTASPTTARAAMSASRNRWPTSPSLSRLASKSGSGSIVQRLFNRSPSSTSSSGGPGIGRFPGSATDWRERRRNMAQCACCVVVPSGIQRRHARKRAKRLQIIAVSDRAHLPISARGVQSENIQEAADVFARGPAPARLAPRQRRQSAKEVPIAGFVPRCPRARRRAHQPRRQRRRSAADHTAARRHEMRDAALQRRGCESPSAPARSPCRRHP